MGHADGTKLSDAGNRKFRAREVSTWQQGVANKSKHTMQQGSVRWGPLLLRAPSSKTQVDISGSSSFKVDIADYNARYVKYRRRERQEGRKYKFDNPSFFLIFSVFAEWQRAIVENKILAKMKIANEIAMRIAEEAHTVLDMDEYTQFVVFETWKHFCHQRVKMRAKIRATKTKFTELPPIFSTNARTVGGRAISSKTNRLPRQRRFSDQTVFFAANGPKAASDLRRFWQMEGVEPVELARFWENAAAEIVLSIDPAEARQASNTADSGVGSALISLMQSGVGASSIVRGNASAGAAAGPATLPALRRPGAPQQRRHRKLKERKPSLQKLTLPNSEPHRQPHPTQDIHRQPKPPREHAVDKTGPYIRIENLGQNGISAPGSAKKGRRGKHLRRPRNPGNSVDGSFLPPVDATALRQYVRREARKREVVLLSCYGPAR
jgi:hypothetical protein